MHCFLKMKQKKREKRGIVSKGNELEKEESTPILPWCHPFMVFNRKPQKKDEYCKYGNMIREMMKEEEEEEKEVATKQKPNITEDADKKMGERV